MKHCDEWIKLNKKDSKGVTQRQHFQTLRKMGAPVLEIELTSVPVELEYLKTYWLQCRRGQVITYQELFYFQQVMHMDIEPWESSIIMQIDNIYWNPSDGNSKINSKSGVSRSTKGNR